MIDTRTESGDYKKIPWRRIMLLEIKENFY
jgi:hypothetical protein